MHRNSRAYRRHHYERLKKKRKYYYGYDKYDPMDKHFLGIITNTPKPCSCPGCSIKRKYDGPSRQEIRERGGIIHRYNNYMVGVAQW